MKMWRMSLIIVAFVAIATFADLPVSTANAESLPKVLGTTDVPGSSNLWLAGMPDGTTADENDIAPDESPVLVSGLVSSAGAWVEFSEASGLVGNNATVTKVGPEGNLGEIANHWTGTEHGKAGLTAPINSLIGVFLDSSIPSGTAPAALDFTSAASRNYLELYPALRQPFWIGDGSNGDSSLQKVFLPAGATRLFLGTLDGHDWYNNTGEFSVVVTQVPEPATLGVLLIGSLALLRRRGK